MVSKSGWGVENKLQIISKATKHLDNTEEFRTLF